MKRIIYILLISTLVTMGCSCAKNGASAGIPHQATQAMPAPTVFNGDSAYCFVAAQVAFGPRVPGSESSAKCAEWLVDKLREYGAQNVTTQSAAVTAYNGDKLPIRNISASFNPELAERMLLFAHWDSRPWADREADPALREQPIDGANDGASGVGVILEIARNMRNVNPRMGVDVLLVDAEDYGRRIDEPADDRTDESWALGTQYWVANPTLDLSKIQYAILLDMVGGKDAVFPREYISQHYARPINNMVWTAAREAGYASRFPNKMGSAVTDDHVYLLRAGIPAVDIIESAHPDTESFPPYWHTHADNLDRISPETLQAVGATLLHLLSAE